MSLFDKIKNMLHSSKIKQDNESMRIQMVNLIEENKALKRDFDDITNKYNQLSVANEYVSREKDQILAERTELAKAKRAEQEEIHNLQAKNRYIKSLFDVMKKANKIYAETENIETLNSVERSYIISDTDISLNCLNVKELRNLYNKNKKNIQNTEEKYEKKYTTKANISIYQLMVIGLESSIQNILSDVKYNKLEQALESLKDVINQYYNIACNGNQSITSTMKKFLIEMELLYTESIKIEYEYYIQKERIKEEQKALREQMKQEAEERKQLELEKKKIEKEESKYNNEINNINQIISNTSDSVKITELQARLKELQIQLNNVQNKKNDIIKLQNGQAGYVYVISNLGSFGNNVFKVGMTRRLEPMDRVNELSSASVPFPFDVHSFIFSDNAVELEKRLHHELNNYRVNKVNLRKEFFRVSIDDLEELVQKICPTAEFNKTMLAEQFKQGMSVDSIPETLAEFTEDDE